MSGLCDPLDYDNLAHSVVRGFMQPGSRASTTESFLWTGGLRRLLS